MTVSYLLGTNSCLRNNIFYQKAEQIAHDKRYICTIYQLVLKFIEKDTRAVEGSAGVVMEKIKL